MNINSAGYGRFEDADLKIAGGRGVSVGVRTLSSDEAASGRCTRQRPAAALTGAAVRRVKPRLTAALLALAAGLTAFLPAPVQAQTAQFVASDWACIPKDSSNQPRFTAGQSFRLLFITTGPVDLSRKRIGYYNRTAQQRAGTATPSCLRRFNAEFRAVVSTAAVAARDNSATTYTNANKGVPIYWLGGEKVADDYADFYDGSWDSVAGTFNNGITTADRPGRGEELAATGSNSDGTRHATAYAGASSVRWGGVTSPVSQADFPATKRGKIYALSPIFTVLAAKPEKPTGLTATRGNQQVTLSWNDPDDSTIVRYAVTYTDGKKEVTTDSGAGTTQHTITGLTNGTEYEFLIMAQNAAGWSPLSDPVTATPSDPSRKSLTASVVEAPAEHDGEEFSVQIQFSEDVETKAKDAPFRVRGGSVSRARRVNERRDLWQVKIQPESAATLKLTLPAGAASTADGRTLSEAVTATVTGRPGVSVADARVKEAKGAVVAFAVTLSAATDKRVMVRYATSDGSAKAGEDYKAKSGRLAFQPGETAKTINVKVLDDAHDEGDETFTLTLSDPTRARLVDAEATGTIENADAVPAALLARFGRATAEQVVEHIEERMATPRRRGFRARFAGQEFQPGSEEDFALGFLSSFAQPMGPHAAGAGPMGGAAMGAGPLAMGSHAAGAGLGGTAGAMGMSGIGLGGTAGAMGTAGRHAPMGGYGPAAGAHGGGLFDSMAPGGDLFSDSEFELNRESRGGILSVWSRSSRSYFSGMEDALSLDGDVRTTMIGADYSRGALTVGLSVGRTLGLGGYNGPSGGRMSTSMTGFYPWVGYQVNDRVSVWGVTGYGTGALSLSPDGASALETGVSMAMSAVGTRGELIGSRATGGFALAFKADALWVGAGSDLLDGAAGRLNASEAGVTRVRTALEGSRGFTFGGRLSLTPSVEVGLRRDGGDAETGAGMDVGGGLAFTDTVTGLSLDVRVRTLVVHQADGFTERGMSLSLGWDPTPSSPLGLSARVAPSWGGEARGGAEALWGNQMAYGMGSHEMYGSGDRVDAEVGYGLPVGARFVGRRGSGSRPRTTAGTTGSATASGCWSRGR